VKVEYLRKLTASPLGAAKVTHIERTVGTRKVFDISVQDTERFFGGVAPVLLHNSEVYGDPEVHPQPETYFGNVNCVGPRGVYDEAKRFAEAMTMAYHQEHGVDTRIARIFNTYGPRLRLDDGRAIPTFIGQALRGEPLTVYGDGKQTRSFCYIDDLVEGIRRLMDHTVCDPVNLGNAEERSILEIAQRILAHVNGTTSRIEFRPLPQDDPKQRQPDLTKARTLLHWQPKTSLDEGLSKTVAWFRQHAHGRLRKPHFSVDKCV